MKRKVAMFPGQGSIYVGMGKKLCENHELARKTFEEASDAIHVDMKKLCFTGDLKELTKTENSQPAILTSSVAAFRVLKETTGFRPHYFAGHSLGEFSALTCANSIDFADAVALVKRRGELMRDASGEGQGIMTAVGKVPKQEIIDICAEISTPENVVCVSNYNSLKQNVISGHKDAVVAAEKRLADLGASVKRLNVSAAFHSPLMQPALEAFKVVLNDYRFRKPEGIVLSNVTARPHTLEDIAARMAEQLVSPVRWQESMEYLKEQKIRLAVDIGPGKVLRNLMFDNFPSVKALTYDNDDNANELIKIIENDKPIPFISRCMGLAVATKNLCTDAQAYETDVVDSYRQLQRMQEKVDAEGRNASEDEMRRAKDLLQKILDTKQVPVNEQAERLQRLYLDTETQSIFCV